MQQTILVVEDDDRLRTLVRLMLEAEGYRVLDARSGALAIALVEATGGPIHLLLTDVVLPELSGPQLARWMATEHPETKVVFMSGYEESRLHGVADSEPPKLIRKPFSQRDLAETVRAALRRSAGTGVGGGS